jgi:ribose 5-phosphate isomerase B
MRVAFACDHGGFPLRQDVLNTIRECGHEVIDFGIQEYERVDFPDYAEKACRALQKGEADRAILICGSGIGISMAANKMRGVLASVCHDTYSAHQGVEHDQMNALCMGGRVIGPELAKEIVRVYLAASHSDQENHIRRVEKIHSIENRESKK